VDLKDPKDLPDVFTSYRKSVEPLREKPRPALARPEKSTLPPFPSTDMIPAQDSPFEIPTSYDELEARLLAPVQDVLANAPSYPENAVSAHPFKGGEDKALSRLEHLILSESVSSYKDTRNGLLGTDFSTKLSGYLSLGCLTARQIHAELVKFEDGTDPKFEKVKGFGLGENEGTKGVRFELLWRDYMRLCTMKFKHKLFRVTGFRNEGKDKWKSPSKTKALPEEEEKLDESYEGSAKAQRVWA
jgi:deoxyribodipyrimidine photo-lyase